MPSGTRRGTMVARLRRGGAAMMGCAAAMVLLAACSSDEEIYVERPVASRGEKYSVFTRKKV